MTLLDPPIRGQGCTAELFNDDCRQALADACAEDGYIWTIYANNFGLKGSANDAMVAAGRPR